MLTSNTWEKHLLLFLYLTHAVFGSGFFLLFLSAAVVIVLLLLSYYLYLRFWNLSLFLNHTFYFLYILLHLHWLYSVCAYFLFYFVFCCYFCCSYSLVYKNILNTSIYLCFSIFLSFFSPCVLVYFVFFAWFFSWQSVLVLFSVFCVCILCFCFYLSEFCIYHLSWGRYLFLVFVCLF